MRKERINILLMVFNLLIICLLLYYTFLRKESERTYYIDNVRLFNEFHMTRDLGRINEKKYRKLLTSHNALLDTINNFQEEINKKKSLTKKDKLRYLKFKKRVSDQEQQIAEIKILVKKEINEKVWQRLNIYIKEFGIKKNAKLIFGVQGNGNIMYGNPLLDLTEEIIDYSNYKYEGN